MGETNNLTETTRDKNLQANDLQVNRTYKDTLFRMIFKDKDKLLSLYNALNGTDYADTAEFEIVTLENEVYMSMKNDLAFIVDLQLYLYEHQSTYNPNMPLRDLIYVTTEYQKLIDKSDLYREKLVKVPAPKFIVFYNGEKKRPEREVRCLSEAFTKVVEPPNLELKVVYININKGMNSELMEACKTLRDYSMFVDRVRCYKKLYGSVREAVNRTVNECIQEDILVEFLEKNRAEVTSMCIFEYDEKAVMEVFKKDAYEDGFEAGITRLILKMHQKSMDISEIAAMTEKTVDEVKEIINSK